MNVTRNDMPHGVWLKPQRRTASAFRPEERLRGPLPRTGPSPYTRRTTLIPQYIDSSRECVSPAAVPAPAQVDATAASAEASEACGPAAAGTFPDGAAKPRTIAVRGCARTPIRRA